MRTLGRDEVLEVYLMTGFVVDTLTAFYIVNQQYYYMINHMENYTVIDNFLNH